MYPKLQSVIKWLELGIETCSLKDDSLGSSY